MWSRCRDACEEITPKHRGKVLGAVRGSLTYAEGQNRVADLLQHEEHHSDDDGRSLKVGPVRHIPPGRRKRGEDAGVASRRATHARVRALRSCCTAARYGRRLEARLAGYMDRLTGKGHGCCCNRQGQPICSNIYPLMTHQLHGRRLPVPPCESCVLPRERGGLFQESRRPRDQSSLLITTMDTILPVCTPRTTRHLSACNWKESRSLSRTAASRLRADGVSEMSAVNHTSDSVLSTNVGPLCGQDVR